MARFQCADCGNRSRDALTCRCGAARQIEICTAHGTRCLHGCIRCRILIRSQSGF